MVGTCSSCEGEKHIVRKLSLTDGDGTLLDSAQYCADCWEYNQQTVERVTGLTGGFVR